MQRRSESGRPGDSDSAVGYNPLQVACAADIPEICPTPILSVKYQCCAALSGAMQSGNTSAMMCMKKKLKYYDRMETWYPGVPRSRTKEGRKVKW
jgi:hypothetical protein